MTWAQPGRPASLQLVDVARPARLEQARERAIGEHLSAGLTARAVIGLVLRVDDPLHRSAADRARLTEAAMDCHLRTERGHFLGEFAARLRAQPLGPLDQHF